MVPFRENIANFSTEPWHSLTEVQSPVQPTPGRVPANVPRTNEKSPVQPPDPVHPPRVDASPDLIKVVYDILTYPYDNIRTRITRLSMSVRVFEKAKLEGLEKGYIIECAAGATTYLIPQPKAFDAFGFPCPYKRNVSQEHSYFVRLGEYLLKQDPANKAVHTELKVGDSGCTADIVTVAHDGTRRAYELTLSTTNILSNAAKCARTDFVQIVFLCRDQKLRDAVRACCREGGLDPNLLAKLDFIQLSTLVRRQRRSSQQ